MTYQRTSSSEFPRKLGLSPTEFETGHRLTRWYVDGHAIEIDLEPPSDELARKILDNLEQNGVLTIELITAK